MVRAMFSGFVHAAKYAPGIALRLAGVSIMLGRIELAPTPLSFRSAAKESIIAIAAAFDARRCAGGVIHLGLAGNVHDGSCHLGGSPRQDITRAIQLQHLVKDA